MCDKTVNENTMKITEFKMEGEFPDLLTFKNGEKVKTAEDWQKKKAEPLNDKFFKIPFNKSKLV